MVPNLQPPPQLWECPNCDSTAATDPSVPNRFHACLGLHGLTAPMVPAGTRCKIEAREREDYIGAEDVQTDGAGRPVMAAVTTRDDGEDVVVYAPTAHGTAGGS